MSESARSPSEREQQSRTESLNIEDKKETTAKLRTRRQNLEDISAVVRHTKKCTKKVKLLPLKMIL